MFVWCAVVQIWKFVDFASQLRCHRQKAGLQFLVHAYCNCWPGVIQPDINTVNSSEIKNFNCYNSTKTLTLIVIINQTLDLNHNWGCHGRDHMVVWFTTTYAISAYHHWCCEFESRSERGVQHYVIKFISDLWQVGGFLRVLQFLPPIKLTTTI